MTRVTLALVASFAFVVAAHAADLPTGTWAVNVDDNKGDLVVKEVKGGKVSGILLDTDFTGTWNGKELRFTSGEYTYEAQLVREPGDKGLTKFTLTGTRTKEVNTFNRAGITHVVKAGGWYAQLSAEAPVANGEITATVRGVLVYGKNSAYVRVTRKVGVTTEETRVYVDGADWKALKATLFPLADKEVVATGPLAQMGKNGGGFVPEGAVYFAGKFDIKLADPK